MSIIISPGRTVVERAKAPERQDGVPPLAAARPPHLRVLGLGLAVLAMAAAGPSPEYGPEVEARFMQRCMHSPGQPSAARCQRAMERLQAEAGYEAFLERAATIASPLSVMEAGRMTIASP